MTVGMNFVAKERNPGSCQHIYSRSGNKKIVTLKACHIVMEEMEIFLLILQLAILFLRENRILVEEVIWSDCF